MLLGISILLVIIIIHLFMENGYLTDIFGIIGVIVVVTGYFSNTNDAYNNRDDDDDDDEVEDDNI